MSVASSWQPERSGPIAVIDIGSNSVRLVVFDAVVPAPQPLINEKALCGLGWSVASSGRIEGESLENTLTCLHRYALVIERLGAGYVDVVATAAVREAENQSEFVQAVKQHCGFDVRVLSGFEEARYSALGVRAAIPNPSGIVADLGGGSLELIGCDDTGEHQGITLPLGGLYLRQRFLKEKAPLAAFIEEHLARADWLEDWRGRDLYTVGGGARALARAHMHAQGHPLRIVQGYRPRAASFHNFLAKVAGASEAKLAKIPGLPKSRLRTSGPAAIVFKQLIERLSPRLIDFVASGLREGIVYSRLSLAQKQADPLLFATAALAARHSRHSIDTNELAGWIAPLEARTQTIDSRLISAACMLADIGWRKHPDHRADQSFHDLLAAPLPAIDHVDRITLAAIIFCRYAGAKFDNASSVFQAARQQIGAKRMREATILGLGLRAALTTSGGQYGILPRMTLKVTTKKMTVEIDEALRPLITGSAEKYLQALAKAVERPLSVRARARQARTTEDDGDAQILRLGG